MTLRQRLHDRAKRALLDHFDQAGPDAYDPLGRVYGQFLSRFGHVTPGAAVNLVVPEYVPGKTFAGLRTATAFGEALAELVGLPLRIVPMNMGLPQLTASVRGRPLGDPRLVPLRALHPGAGDIWVATMWYTAAALRLAASRGLLSSTQVVYLVQDYEPAFSPWSADYALARATYHCGFELVVNSIPLARFLESQENLTIPGDRILGPVINVGAFRAAGRMRPSSAYPSIFFYARPSKPRNMYGLGAAALTLFSREMQARNQAVSIITAGEAHRPFETAAGTQVGILGQTGWDEYVSALSQVDIALSLMHSPHPSHPPLDCALAGARVVTNRFGPYRDGLHPNITAVDPTPEGLAQALATSVDAWIREPTLPEHDIAHLGESLSTVVRSVTAALGELNA